MAALESRKEARYRVERIDGQVMWVRAKETEAQTEVQTEKAVACSAGKPDRISPLLALGLRNPQTEDREDGKYGKKQQSKITNNKLQ